MADQRAKKLQESWELDKRWKGIKRPYTAEDVIKLREQDIATFENTLKDTNEKNQVALANMYYTQAQTLEVVADRTNFSPRKKKQAISEAIELYKVSLSLGKTEAQDRINELEKELS